MKRATGFFVPLIIVAAIYLSGAAAQGLPASAAGDALTIAEAAAALPVPGAAAPLAHPPETTSTRSLGPFAPPFTSIAPVQLFDNLYFVGTTAVGAFVVDTGDGLVMLDTGCGATDAALMTADMKKLGLDPSRIKLILLSHEHFDHYGGVQYLKKHVCPNAKVALSLIGWNMLQTVPMEFAYLGPRPQSVDIYLSDGMKIKVGATTFQVVATPGHSAGCMSFIIPVTDHGEPHVVGIMGGSAVWATPHEARLYKSSIEYFKAFAAAAGCDAGLGVHSQEATFAPLRARKPGEANPLVLGTEKFDTVYLQKYRDQYRSVLDSGKMQPYPGLVLPSRHATAPEPAK
ncbi:MBL fold metallo-hydrolase [Geobacter sp. FeAm09]|uniref:MBL fold metallo-hydrolase n=1 Tax=Geobacter sp. FeAm09 TaxID=2597769 RepID=UPI00143D34A4|nr:MBL fold metallo-hydrolase [Geobacter sp. FeAm09]